jgi:Rod binding domain-containing protein
MNVLPIQQNALQSLSSDPKALAAQLRAGGKEANAAVAKGFEGLFMSLVLKEMRKTLEPGTLFGKDSGDVQGGLFDLYLGQHLAKSGGLGLARMLQNSLDTRGHK